MGFKCPVCKKDFGTEKEEFQEHLDLENYKIDLKTLSYINSREPFIHPPGGLYSSMRIFIKLIF